MENWKIIGKIATFFAIVSIIFVIFSALVTFFLIQIVSTGAPTEYIVFSILSDVMLYLFLTVLSLVIAAVSWGIGKEKENIETEEEPEEEKETAPAAEPTE